MQRALIVVCLGAVTLVACPGLLTDAGNDFPCDFSKPPGERDAVCSPGDVCGVQNRCQRFRYEGPQFEGKPTFPFFSDGGARLHPLVITGPIDFVARVHGAGEAIVVHEDAGSFLINRMEVMTLPFRRSPHELEDTILSTRLMPVPHVMGRELNNEVFFEGGNGPNQNRVFENGMPLRAVRLRAFEAQGRPQRAVLTTPPSRGGVIGPGPVFSQITTSQEPLDVGPGPVLVGRERPVVVLSKDGFRVHQPDDGGLPLVAQASFPDSSVMSVDVSGSTFAVMSQGAARLSLSTWSATRTSAGFDLAPAWSDCTPCAGDVKPPLAFTAGQDVSGPFVDVLCASDGLHRVRGAQTASTLSACIEEEGGLPFDFEQIAQRTRAASSVAVQDFSDPTSFLAGGKKGQVWAGSTIGTAVPLFLDRVPLDVFSVDVPGREGLLALTPVGAFLRFRDEAMAAKNNGFRVVAPDRTSRLAAFIHNTAGWAVNRDGHLVLAAPRDDFTVDFGFGPRLVDGRGEPVTRVLRGEGITSLDGGLISMVVAADDSLYFVPAPEMTTRSPGLLGDVSPVLTPEPSTLIRSLALERTPIGTDGVSRVRGYLVTSRNVYEFKLGGAPLQWTASPLTLSGAEPVEVWFDNPRGGLGRVGYRDGTIFSIPGGFQLTETLPANDAGVPTTALDYENLGGWPVALTSTGLFVARYEALPDGRLDTRFPDGGLNKLMTWREVTLPDGSRPWRANDPRRAELKPGKLHVIADPQTGTDRAYRRLFHLLVFLPNQVIEVGQHERTNISTPIQ